MQIPYFIHPAPLLAVVILAINDHYLKLHYPSWITGKLSDFAGLFFFPLFLAALWNVARSTASHRSHWLTRQQLIFTIGITDVIFIGVKFVPPITSLYLTCTAALGFPSRVTPDPTDLIALSVHYLTWRFGVAQIQRHHCVLK